MATASINQRDLEAIGLPSYEAKVLTLLITTGKPTRAIELAKATKTSRQRVYEVLNALKSSGVVKEVQQRPTLFEASLEKLGNLIDLATKKLSDEERELSWKKDRIFFLKQEIDRHGASWDVHFVSTFEQATKNTIKICRNTVPGDELLIMAKTFDWLFTKLKDDLSSSIARGAIIRVLLKEPDQKDSAEKEKIAKAAEFVKEIGADYSYYEPGAMRITMRSTRHKNGTLMPAEGQMILWYRRSAIDYKLEEDQTTPCNIYFTTDPYLLRDMRRIFDYHWVCSKLRQQRSKTPEIDRAITVLSEKVMGFANLLQNQ